MNRELFIKVMMLTTSDNDGEALAALRKANGMLRAEGRDWRDLLNGLVTSAHRTSPSPRARDGPEDRSVADDQTIDAMFDMLLQRTHAASFMHFLQSLHGHWNNKGYLTRAQFEALERAYHNRRRR